MKKLLTALEEQALKTFQTSLQALLKEDLLVLRLFGSKARGEATEESDIDVLVLVRQKSRAICRRIVEESLEIDLTYGTNLAPTILSSEEYRQNKEFQTPFYRSVEHEGIAL